MRRLRLNLLCLGALCVPAAADELSRQPYELVRELQIFQDQAALKATSARAEQREQRERIAKVASQLMSFGPKVWSDPRNMRAAIIYALSGGDPRILRSLLASGAVTGLDERLAKGSLYASVAMRRRQSFSMASTSRR